jgi:hypothetical protein
MDDYVFARVGTIPVTLLVTGFMDILAVVITTVRNMLWRVLTINSSRGDAAWYSGAMRPKPLMHAAYVCCLGRVTDEGLLGGTGF